MDSLAQLSASWREQAVGLYRSAKNYDRSCVKAKAAQLILCARQLEGCANELDQACKALAQSGEAAAQAESPER